MHVHHVKSHVSSRTGMVFVARFCSGFFCLSFVLLNFFWPVLLRTRVVLRISGSKLILFFMNLLGLVLQDQTKNGNFGLVLQDQSGGK